MEKSISSCREGPLPFKKAKIKIGKKFSFFSDLYFGYSILKFSLKRGILTV